MGGRTQTMRTSVRTRAYRRSSAAAPTRPWRGSRSLAKTSSGALDSVNRIRMEEVTHAEQLWDETRAARIKDFRRREPDARAHAQFGRRRAFTATSPARWMKACTRDVATGTWMSLK